MEDLWRREPEGAAVATLNVKNLPDGLYRKLQARARRQRRSVAHEITQILNEVLETPERLSILDLKGLGKELWRDIGWPTTLNASARGGTDIRSGARRGRGRHRGVHLIEEHPRFLPHILPLFEQADHGVRVLVTSALTLLEVLVVPYRTGNRQLAERHERLLTRSRGLRLVDVTRDQLRAAAQLRAATGVKTPDAPQLASALATGVERNSRGPSDCTRPGARTPSCQRLLQPRTPR